MHRGPALRTAQSLRGDFDSQSAAAHDGASRLQRDEIALDIAELDAVANLERLARRAAFTFARGARRHPLDSLRGLTEHRAKLALRLAPGLHLLGDLRALAPQVSD